MDTLTLICVGGAGGIGSACSRLFASRGNWPSSHCSASRLPLQRSATDHADERAGWRVCVLDTAESLGAALAEELGPCAFFHAIDVGSEISVVAAFSAALSFSEGRLDALVVMSAKFLYGEVHTINAEQWADVCRINLAGPAL
jgi:NAD(P)-dependent dehydrogenase (short-subunit alcohol dehydrogenase family)